MLMHNCWGQLMLTIEDDSLMSLAEHCLEGCILHRGPFSYLSCQISMQRYKLRGQHAVALAPIRRRERKVLAY